MAIQIIISKDTQSLLVKALNTKFVDSNSRISLEKAKEKVKDYCDYKQKEYNQLFNEINLYWVNIKNEIDLIN